MTWPHLTLLVAIYVSLDVANPLMPGALSFGADESVEARQADRFRTHDDVGAAARDPARDIVAVAEPTVVRRGMTAAVRPHARWARVIRSHPSPPLPASSPEDH
jgi:hypothetical protein